MCAWFEDDRLVEAFANLLEGEAGFFEEVAVTVGRVARQAAPIVTAVPVPQAQIIGDVAGLLGNVSPDAIDAFADEWRAGVDDGAG